MPIAVDEIRYRTEIRVQHITSWFDDNVFLNQKHNERREYQY